MDRPSNKANAQAAADLAFANPDADDNTAPVANGLAAIAYALLHLADVLEEKD